MNSSHRLIILVAFTFSGCAGLIYESVWSHYLGLYLGHAAYAQTLTLAIFMGGMTLGAYFTSRYIGRVSNALLGYAIAELVLGIAGLLFHEVYTTLVAVSYDSIFPALANTDLINIYKWSSAALLLLPQSIVLGATFPLLCSALIRREDSGTGRHISILYFSNSIGAAAGALIATFVLIPSIGMPGAMLTSGIINFIVAIATYYVAKQPEIIEKEPISKSTTDTKLVKIALLVAAITGGVSFMYEIAWIRMLNLVLGTSLHAFEIMLSAFIAGIAFGGWWIRNRIDKIRNLVYFVGLVQIFMGLAAISTLVLYVESFNWVATLLNQALLKTDIGYVFYNIATSLIAGLIMIPATFCAGMTLPLLTTQLIRSGENESAIGKVYASNTVGAILGILFAVHVGFTTLGLKWLIVLAGVVDIGLGLYLLAYIGVKQWRFTLKTCAMVAAVSLVAVFGVATDFNPSMLASGTYRSGAANINSDVAFYRDGKTASISVLFSDGNTTGTIATNGKPDAGIRIKHDSAHASMVDEVTMAMAGAMPYLINPNVENVANIGFGSGLTSQILLSDPDIVSLDTIEIEPVMVEGAQLFRDRNHLVFDDQRSHIYYEDAKTFFAAQQKKYDAIISEPSNPWVAGVGNLFTEEFYTHVKRYLNEDGMLVQWLHLYEISIPTLLTALGSLDAVFDNYNIYATNVADILIVASPNKQLDLSIKSQWETMPDELKAELELIGMNNIERFKSRKIANKEEIAALISAPAQKVSFNSDYFPLLSLNAPRDRYKGSSSLELFDIQLLGIYDNPYRNPVLHQIRNLPDSNHPYYEKYTIVNKFERILLDNKVEGLDFYTWGVTQTLLTPNEFCQTPESRNKWVEAFHRVSILANDLGSARLRDFLKMAVNQFTCSEMLEPKFKHLLTATTISLGKLEAKHIIQLRKMIELSEKIEMEAKFRSFIFSCYLSSQIVNTGNLTAEDHMLVSRISNQFDLTNQWLEAILVRKLLKKLN